MARKIYDILHPKVEQNKNNFSPKRKVYYFNGKFRKFIPLLIIVFLLIVGFGYFSFIKAEIKIWPETTLVEYEGTIKVGKEVLHYNIEEGIIPGELFITTQSKSQNFNSTGREVVEKRANGVLTVFNNHSASPQTLVAQTRFLSADGILFRSTEKVIIPGRSQGIPGEAEVPVVAAEPGEGHNIERVVNFSVPGLHGTPMFTTIYAKNKEPITGGYIGELSTITESDVEKAREALLSIAIKNAIEEIKKQAPGFVVNEEMLRWEIIKEVIEPKVGEAQETFAYSIDVEVKIFTFRETIIQEFLREALLKDSMVGEDINLIFSGKDIWKESLKIDYETDLRGLEEGSISLTVNASALSHPIIRKDLIKNELSGMLVEEAVTSLNNHEKIQRAEINLRPSWLKRIPKAKDIDIIVRVDFNPIL